ncbi:hypothetical protein GE061_013134 [Apolygus lucorum]|uniref:Uncharacterized protein n=1 Tax=Apolygus lucorum TaxID=248454 RepID=A0A6A4JPX9_APOLU|nr:hypothetical protein GE061_013134 [Apolygus lucorum]
MAAVRMKTSLFVVYATLLSGLLRHGPQGRWGRLSGFSPSAIPWTKIKKTIPISSWELTTLCDRKQSFKQM